MVAMILKICLPAVSSPAHFRSLDINVCRLLAWFAMMRAPRRFKLIGCWRDSHSITWWTHFCMCVCVCARHRRRTSKSKVTFTCATRKSLLRNWSPAAAAATRLRLHTREFTWLTPRRSSGATWSLRLLMNELKKLKFVYLHASWLVWPHFRPWSWLSDL